MKKIIFLAAAALAFFGCSEKPVDGPSAKDSIELSAQSKTLDGKGGAFSVMVTRSADWTLTSTEDYSSWVTPSATTGERFRGGYPVRTGKGIQQSGRNPFNGMQPGRFCISNRGVKAERHHIKISDVLSCPLHPR